jgi:putative hydrolase of the HAD superfamily
VGKADLKEAVAPYLPSFGWKGTAEELLEYWFRAEHSLNEALMDDVSELRRRGARVVLATNQEKYRTQYMLEHMGFEGKFDKIYSSAHLGLKKPAVEFFAKVVADMGARPGEVLFWDDDKSNIDGAEEFGIHAEFYEGYDHFRRLMKERYGFDMMDA